MPVWLPGLFTVTVLPWLPPPTMACVRSHALVSLDQLACSAKVPKEPNDDVGRAARGPELSQAHSSEFSWPL